MKINKANITHIHELLITDLKLRLHENGMGTVYTNDTELEYQLESLDVTVKHTNTIQDINDVIIEYGELFQEQYSDTITIDEIVKNNLVDVDIFTLDGTMNYVLGLSLLYYTKFKHKSIYRG